MSGPILGSDWTPTMWRRSFSTVWSPTGTTPVSAYVRSRQTLESLHLLHAPRLSEEADKHDARTRTRPPAVTPTDAEAPANRRDHARKAGCTAPRRSRSRKTLSVQQSSH